ncbi:MAG: DinB family protein [Candidatus Acidiferrales bacterium]
MTQEEAATLASHLLSSLQRESLITRNVFAALPDDQAGYRIHPKARTALELAWHIVMMETWFLDSIFQGQFYAGVSSKVPNEIKTGGDVVMWYSEQFEPNFKKASKLSGEYLARPMSFLRRFDYPAVIYLQMILSHTIHHRGQFAAYLRAMGAKVPAIYGGSLDEPVEKSAEA